MNKHRAWLISLGAIIALTGIGFVAKAGTAPVGFIARPAEAADLKGDNNGIGLFHRNEDNKNLVKVFGKVTAISDTSITIMSKWDLQNSARVTTETSYTFKIDDATEVLRRFRALSSVDEMAVGDRVRIWGTALTDGTAKLIWDSSIWWIRLNGTVANLDTDNQTFRLLITRMSADQTETTFSVSVKTNDATLYVNADGTPATFSDLANGSEIRVRGVWNHMGRYLTARNVKFL